MNKIIEFLKTRKIWYWLTFAATVLMLVELVIYLTTGITHLDNVYSTRAIVGMAVGLAIGGISLVKTFRAALFAQYVFGLFAFINYITSQLNLLGSLIYGVDGETLPVTLVIGLVVSLVAWVLSLVAAILMKSSAKAKESKIV